MSQQPTALPAEAVAQLERVWRDLAPRFRDEVTRDELRPIAQVVGAAALRAGMRPEQLVIGIKESWAAQRGHRRPEDLHDARWVVAEVILLSVCEYFHSMPGYVEAAHGRPPATSAPRIARPACCARRLASAAAQRPYLIAPDADDLALMRRLTQ